MAIPNCLKCPISLGVMRDPLLAPDTYTYERKDLVQALASKPVSPLTRAPMTLEECIPNRAVQEMIKRELDKHPEWASERRKPTFEEVREGKFDEFDSFEPGDFNKEEWGGLMKDHPELFKRMKITNYNGGVKGNSRTLLMVATGKDLEELVKWLYPQCQIKVSNKWSFPQKPDYKYHTSPLTLAIGNRNLSLVKFFLDKDLSLLDESEVADLIQRVSPYQFIDLLTPYQDRLESLDWEEEITSRVSAVDKVFLRASLEDFILKYVRNEDGFRFLTGIKKIYERAQWRGPRVLMRRLSDDPEVIRILSAYLEGCDKDWYDLSNSPSLATPTELLDPDPYNEHTSFSSEMHLAWNYRIRRPGWEKKLLDAGWIKPVDSE